MFSSRGVALNVTTASIQLCVLNNSVYLSARLKLRSTNSSCLVAMASTEGDFSASHSRVLLWQPPMQNSCLLTTQLTGSQAGGHLTPTSWSSLHRLSTDNWTLSLTNQVLHISSLNWTADNYIQHAPRRKHHSSCCVGVCCHRNVYTEPLLRNRLHNPIVLLLQALPSSCHCL
jgi:hypothetical protein